VSAVARIEFGETNVIAVFVCLFLAEHAWQKKGGTELATRTTELLNEADRWLDTVCSTVDVDVMPGDHDLTTHFLPQQPLLRSMFPLSKQHASLNLVSNPHACTIEGVT
jgi:DNA polymerase delta subunit 2